MVTFKNNNRRPNFRSNNRRPSFRRNDEGPKFSNSDNFQRKIPGRNNYNASKLIEKYNDLAREALANEDKILSENYFQHADHFTRILSEQSKNRLTKPNNVEVEVVASMNIDEKKEKSNESEENENIKTTEKKTATN